MQEVTLEELERMDDQSKDCATLLSDARCDVLAYACLIGIMAQGLGLSRGERGGAPREDRRKRHRGIRGHERQRAVPRARTP